MSSFDQLFVNSAFNATDLAVRTQTHAKTPSAMFGRGLPAVSSGSLTMRKFAAFEVATFKVEYVEESQGVRERHLSARSAFLARFEQSIDLVA